MSAPIHDSEFDLSLTPRLDESHRRFVVKHNVGTYRLGAPRSRFAVTWHPCPVWRFPWQRPRGGWWVGHRIVWWSK